MESGISQGIRPGDFGAELPATWWQVQTLCRRAFGRPEGVGSGQTATVDDVCGIALEAAGVLPWASPRMYDEEAVEICQAAGILPEALDPTAPATRGDAAEILWRVATGRYHLPEAPVTLRAEADYLSHPLGQVRYLLELRKLPEGLLKTFRDRGGVVVIGDDAVEAYHQRTGSYVQGLYWVGQYRMDLAAPWALAHEFGHVLDELRGWPEHPSFQREAETLAEVLGWRYCTTDPDEFFAEAFALYCNDPEALAAAAPETYQELARSLAREEIT